MTPREFKRMPHLSRSVLPLTVALAFVSGCAQHSQSHAINPAAPNELLHDLRPGAPPQQRPPQHNTLKTPAEMHSLQKRPLPASVAKRLEKKIQGSWKRTGYWLWDKRQGHYMEVGVRKDRIDETVETWLLRPNKRFRHIMSENLFFTGHWAIDAMVGSGRSADRPPHTVILVLDVSGTMAGRPIAAARDAALALTKRMSARDRLGLVTVGSSVSKTPLSTPRGTLQKKLTNLRATGKRTRLLDGISAALSMVGSRHKARTSIVVLSDGKDEGSKVDLVTCLSRAETAGIPIHSVGYSRVEKKYLSTLKALSRSSGGQYLSAAGESILTKTLNQVLSMAIPMGGGGAYFVLHTTDVRSSIPSMRRANDYFVGTYLDNGRDLVLFYLGTKFDLKKGGLRQGHIFQRVPYGER